MSYVNCAHHCCCCCNSVSGLQEGAGQVLSLCMRIYCHNKSSPTVVSTAAATVRQAVALLFDHAVMGTSNSSSSNAGVDGVATGREIAAVLLLQDLLNMCAGAGHVVIEQVIAALACRQIAVRLLCKCAPSAHPPGKQQKLVSLAMQR